MNTLTEVAECLNKANVTINAKKPKFGYKHLRYFGFIVGNGQIQTDPEKVSAIKYFRKPKSPRQVRGIMGLAGWYRRFVPNFASNSATITDCLKKDKKFVFTEETAQAFEQIKEALIASPVL